MDDPQTRCESSKTGEEKKAGMKSGIWVFSRVPRSGTLVKKRRGERKNSFDERYWGDVEVFLVGPDVFVGRLPC